MSPLARREAMTMIQWNYAGEDQIFAKESCDCKMCVQRPHGNTLQHAALIACWLIGETEESCPWKNVGKPNPKPWSTLEQNSACDFATTSQYFWMLFCHNHSFCHKNNGASMVSGNKACNDGQVRRRSILSTQECGDLTGSLDLDHLGEDLQFLHFLYLSIRLSISKNLLASSSIYSIDYRPLWCDAEIKAAWSSWGDYAAHAFYARRRAIDRVVPHPFVLAEPWSKIESFWTPSVPNRWVTLWDFGVLLFVFEHL